MTDYGRLKKETTSEIIEGIGQERESLLSLSAPRSQG
jgi:hypothetical protein